MFFYSLLAVLAVNFGSSMSLGFDSTEGTDRIINGSTAEPGQFPYMVSVRELGRFFHVDPVVHWRHTCGGSVISKRWVVTVAHCTNGPPSAFQIYVGAHHINNDGTAHAVERIVIHPKYKAPSSNSDISLMKTIEKIQTNDLVKPIPLRRKFVGIGVKTIVTGWGNSDFKLRVRMESSAFCTDAVERFFLNHRFIVYIFPSIVLIFRTITLGQNPNTCNTCRRKRCRMNTVVNITSRHYQNELITQHFVHMDDEVEVFAISTLVVHWPLKDN